MGLFKTAAKVAVASSVHGRVQQRQQGKWSQPAQAQPMPAAPVQPAMAPAALGGMDAKLAQLKQLGDLRDAGIITEAEFEVKKHQVMNS